MPRGVPHALGGLCTRCNQRRNQKDDYDPPPTAAPQGRSGQEGETKEKKVLTFESITKRIAAIDKMEEAEKRKARRILIRRVMKGIAEGTIGDPAKAAQAAVHLFGNKAEDDSGDA